MNKKIFIIFTSILLIVGIIVFILNIKDEKTFEEYYSGIKSEESESYSELIKSFDNVYYGDGELSDNILPEISDSKVRSSIASSQQSGKYVFIEVIEDYQYGFIYYYYSVDDVVWYACKDMTNDEAYCSSLDISVEEYKSME